MQDAAAVARRYHRITARYWPHTTVTNAAAVLVMVAAEPLPAALVHFFPPIRHPHRQRRLRGWRGSSDPPPAPVESTCWHKRGVRPRPLPHQNSHCVCREGDGWLLPHPYMPPPILYEPWDSWNKYYFFGPWVLCVVHNIWPPPPVSEFLGGSRRPDIAHVFNLLLKIFFRIKFVLATWSRVLDIQALGGFWENYEKLVLSETTFEEKSNVQNIWNNDFAVFQKKNIWNRNGGGERKKNDVKNIYFVFTTCGSNSFSKLFSCCLDFITFIKKRVCYFDGEHTFFSFFGNK